MVPHKVRMKACPPPPVHHPNTLENEHRHSFSMVTGPLPAPPPYHPQKRAMRLVFNGGLPFTTTTTLPPSKTSDDAHFRLQLVLCHHHHPTTINNKCCCSFSMVAG